MGDSLRRLYSPVKIRNVTVDSQRGSLSLLFPSVLCTDNARRKWSSKRLSIFASSARVHPRVVCYFASIDQTFLLGEEDQARAPEQSRTNRRRSVGLKQSLLVPCCLSRSHGQIFSQQLAKPPTRRRK